MPKKIDPAVRERVMRMVADHQGEYSTPTELAKVIAARERIGRETSLKAKVRRLEEDNAILKAATVFFVGELDPRNR